MDAASKHDLVARAKDGDRQAFGVLVEFCHARVRLLVRLRLGAKLGRKVDVDDVLHETYLQAFRTIKTFEWRDDNSFVQWLSAVAERVILNLVRHFGAKKRNWHNCAPLSLGWPGPANGSGGGRGDIVAADVSTPSRDARREERLDRLEAALEELKPEQREAIILTRIHGLPVKEVARRLDKTPEAVSMLILRGLRNLRNIFGSTASLRLPQRGLRSRFPVDPPPGSGPSNGTAARGGGI